MIYTNNGKLQMKGDSIEIFADIALILKSYREIAEESFSKDESIRQIDKIVEISKLSKEEVENRINEIKQTLRK